MPSFRKSLKYINQFSKVSGKHCTFRDEKFHHHLCFFEWIIHLIYVLQNNLQQIYRSFEFGIVLTPYILVSPYTNVDHPYNLPAFTSCINSIRTKMRHL